MDRIIESALTEVLAQLASTCPDFAGAVVATRDGLVMAACGEYQGDAPAACAASLSVHLQDDLQALGTHDRDAGLQEVLVFGDNRLWYLSRLAAGHLLLVGSRQTVHVGAVRLVGQAATAALNRSLKSHDHP